LVWSTLLQCNYYKEAGQSQQLEQGTGQGRQTRQSCQLCPFVGCWEATDSCSDEFFTGPQVGLFTSKPLFWTKLKKTNQWRQCHSLSLSLVSLLW